MKTENMKTKQKYIPRALLLASVLLAFLIGAKVYAFAMASKQIPIDIEKTLKAPDLNKENIEKFQSLYTEAVGALKKKNFYLPPKATKSNPVTKVTAIMGDEVMISNKWYKVGDKIQDAEVTSISPNLVTIVWNEKEIRLQPFDTMAVAAAPSAPSRQKKEKRDKPDKNMKKPRPQPQMEQRPEKRPKMSDEERKRLREEFIKKMKARGGSKGSKSTRPEGGGSREPRGSSRPMRGGTRRPR